MLRFGRTRFIALFSTLLVALTLVSTDFAEARRGGSFGSRGMRTWQAPAPTRTAPNPTGPIERSMTPAPNTATRQQQTLGQQRPGMFSGFGGSLMRGLLIGGLFGMLLGYGFGGLAGALGFLVQLLLIGLLVSFAMAWFRSRREPATADGAPYGGGNGFGHARIDTSDTKTPAGGFTIPSIGGGAASAAPATQDISLDKSDLDTFERRLAEVQKAFSDEDHAALRRLSTPEMVSYFSEELADNAKRGLRNDVSDVHLVQADIAESWREDGTDYATAAFQYEAVDVMRDRASGKVVEGDENLTETTELWTFVRPRGGEWKLSAIQEI
ncbi:MAG: Tim44 domain-containing protein [Pseudomonadota bacterium]